MPTRELVPYADPLDLLRRFTPTPFEMIVQVESALVLLRTNDSSFVSSISVAETSVSSFASPACLWKIVRDVDVRGKATEASIVVAENLVFFSMGPACLIGADRERKEILAFIGIDVDVRTFQESILPSLGRLTEFVTRASRDVSDWLDNPEFAVGGRCNA